MYGKWPRVDQPAAPGVIALALVHVEREGSQLRGELHVHGDGASRTSVGHGTSGTACHRRQRCAGRAASLSPAKSPPNVRTAPSASVARTNRAAATSPMASRDVASQRPARPASPALTRCSAARTPSGQGDSQARRGHRHVQQTHDAAQQQHQRQRKGQSTSSTPRPSCNGAPMNPARAKRDDRGQPSHTMASTARHRPRTVGCEHRCRRSPRPSEERRLVEGRGRYGLDHGCREGELLLSLGQQQRDLAEVLFVHAAQLGRRCAQDERRVIEGETPDAVPVAHLAVQVAHRSGAEEARH